MTREPLGPRVHWTPEAFPGFSPGDLSRFRGYYKRQAARGAANARRVGWANSESQKVRFEVFASLAPIAGKKILDVGCGLGAFALFLKDRGIEPDYRGVDLFPGYIREARRAVPWGAFEVRHLLDRPLRPGSSDYGFLSGVFNVRIQNNWDYLTALTGAVLKTCRKGVAFNVLHAGSGLKDPKRFTVDPKEIVVWGRRQRGVRKVKVLDHYLPNDLTVWLDKAKR